MEVETGSTCSVMSFKELGKLQDLKESLLKLGSYTGELVKPYGTPEVKVLYEDTGNRLPLLVVMGDMPMLLDWNWFQKVKLDWRTIKLKAIVMEFDSVFSEEMGCLKKFKVKILIHKTVGPRFCWAKLIHKGRLGKRTGPSGIHQGIFKRAFLFSVVCSRCASGKEKQWRHPDMWSLQTNNKCCFTV